MTSIERSSAPTESPVTRKTGRHLHIITDLDVGGAERMLVNYLCARNDVQSPAEVLCLKTPGVMEGPLLSAGITVHTLDLPEPRGWKALWLALKMPFAIMRAARLIDELKPTAIKGWMYHAAVIGDMAVRRSKTGQSARFIAGIRCSAMDGSLYGPVHRMTVDRMRTIAGRVDALAYNSESGRREHEAIGFSPEKACVVPNGVNTEAFAPNPGCRVTIRRKFGIDEDRPVMIAAARVDPMKDYPTLLKAFEMIEGRADLIVAGKDTNTVLPIMPGLHRLGTRKDMADLYGAADMIVMSSAFGEGFPNVVGEGMACGLIPIVTDVGDAAIIAGDTGAIVPPGDAEALATAMIRMIDAGREAIAHRKIAARKRIQTRFSLKSGIDRLDALMDGVPYVEPEIVEDEEEEDGDQETETPESDSEAPDET